MFKPVDTVVELDVDADNVLKFDVLVSSLSFVINSPVFIKLFSVQILKIGIADLTQCSIYNLLEFLKDYLPSRVKC